MASSSDTALTEPAEQSASSINRADQFTAAFFGNGSLPKGSPAWLAAAVEEQVRFAQALPGTGELTIGQAGGGSLGTKTREEREEFINRDALALMRSVAEEAARQERERWAEERHSFGNVEMSGAEWSQLGDDLHHDTELRRWLVERLRQDGRSEADANTKANDIADVATIMGKPESQRTAEERAKLDRAKNDPTLMKTLVELNGQRLNGHDRLEPTAAAQANRDISTAVGADHINAPGHGGDGLAPATSLIPEASPQIASAPMPRGSAGLSL